MESAQVNPAGGPRLTVADPHIHLWDTARVSYPWLDRRSVTFSGDNRLLPVPYTVDDFLRDAADVELVASVHVEANPADGLEEVGWLQSLADDPLGRGHPQGIVAYTDLSQPTAPAVLDSLARYPNMRGIRQILNVHVDPRYDYVGRHYLSESPWRRNLSRLAGHGWSFDLQLYPAQIPVAATVIDANPDITFIVNHAGMFVDRNTVEGWREWRNGLRSLADRGNTAIKLSGLAMFDHRWTLDSFRPYVLEAIDAFGPNRCMFASNFPIDRLHANYSALWHTYASLVAGATEAERRQLLCSNAIRYYRLS